MSLKELITLSKELTKALEDIEKFKEEHQPGALRNAYRIYRRMYYVFDNMKVIQKRKTTPCPPEKIVE